MIRKAFDKLIAFGIKIANIGVHDGLSFSDKKKTQIINVIVSLSCFPKIYYGIRNYEMGKYPLAIMNLVQLLGGLAILAVHHYRMYTLARMTLVLFSCLLFAAGAILYRNGGEFFLLANLIVVIAFFPRSRFLIATSLFNCLLYIGIKIFHKYSDFVYDSVPFERVMVNTVWAFLVVSIALWYFKTEEVGHLIEIEKKNKALEEANRTKEKLFSIISHDLRSPLAQLKGSLELVKHDYISPEQFSGLADKIAEQVTQVNDTLDNLLRWSLSQLGGITAKPQQIEVAVVADECIKTMQPRTEEKDVQVVTCSLNQTVWADPEHLRVILRNILSNAVKYSHPGGIIHVCAEKQGSEVVIKVKDEGVGMSKQLQDELLHTDTVTSRPGTSLESGTGLGIRLCKEFITRNQGRMTLESEEGKGTCFGVQLPVG